jgi:hypothetical protein
MKYGLAFLFITQILMFEHQKNDYIRENLLWFGVSKENEVLFGDNYQLDLLIKEIYTKINKL